MKYGTKINSGYFVIKRAMSYKGYDNQYMADQLGIKKETFCRYMNNNTSTFNEKQRQKLMDIFKDVIEDHCWSTDVFFMYK